MRSRLEEIICSTDMQMRTRVIDMCVIIPPPLPPTHTHPGLTRAPSGTPPPAQPAQPPPPPQTRGTQSHSAPTSLKRPMLTPKGGHGLYLNDNEHTNHNHNNFGAPVQENIKMRATKGVKVPCSY